MEPGKLFRPVGQLQKPSATVRAGRGEPTQFFLGAVAQDRRANRRASHHDSWSPFSCAIVNHKCATERRPTVKHTETNQPELAHANESDGERISCVLRWTSCRPAVGLGLAAVYTGWAAQRPSAAPDWSVLSAQHEALWCFYLFPEHDDDDDNDDDNCLLLKATWSTSEHLGETAWKTTSDFLQSSCGTYGVGSCTALSWFLRKMYLRSR